MWRAVEMNHAGSIPAGPVQQSPPSGSLQLQLQPLCLEMSCETFEGSSENGKTGQLRVDECVRKRSACECV